MKSALIVVDVQESFRQRPYWSDAELPAFIANTQSLIDACHSRGVPVLQVFHRERDGGAANPFNPESGYVHTLQGVDVRPQAIFHKEVHSAMFARDEANTTLQEWLGREGIGELLVTGIRTEQCCETTTRHASDLGFRVRYVTDATLTFAMQSRQGKQFSPAEIRERTELVLDGRFAQIVSAATALV